MGQDPGLNKSGEMCSSVHQSAFPEPTREQALPTTIASLL